MGAVITVVNNKPIERTFQTPYHSSMPNASNTDMYNMPYYTPYYQYM